MPASPSPADSKVCPLCDGTFNADMRFCPRDGSALAARRPADDLLGQVVDGRFFVTKLLGEGAMGTVYLAEQVRMQRLVALKVIRDRSKLDAAAVVRFSREAKNASRIAHTNVAAVYEFGEFEQGLVYMAMEYVEGEPLSALLARETALPPRRAASIAGQIADALVAAHEHDIIHRDLKPENVMLARRRGGSDLVKVVDFGIARLVGAESQVVTGTGLSSGTPRYMSPEQLLGEEVDARSDIFALGLISFVMLVGRQPWDTDSAASQPVVRIGGRARTLREHRPSREWPDELQAILDKAMALDPADRYDNASVFGDELAAAIVRWIPDDGAAQVPWNKSLRFESTPRGVRRYTPGEPRPAVQPPGPTSDEAMRAPNGAPSPVAASVADPVVAPLPRPQGRGAIGWRAAMLTIAALGVGGLAIMLMAPLWRPVLPAAAPDSTSMLAGEAPAQPNDTSAALRTQIVNRGLHTAVPAASIKPNTTGGEIGDSSNITVPDDAGTEMPRGYAAGYQLDRLKRLTDAVGANTDSARTALALARETLPRLTSLTDSIEAQYYMAEAHLILDDTRQACRLLLAIEAAAKKGPFARAVANLLADPGLPCR